ncbi:galactoside alpha-(1,2)-fucosyltransferase 2-like isoform X2 [Mytilus californianus]|uniref:galactoside alpha-(1,2)-fucosyltransferase 2-like isoform X2 n=1 Tax=Mytilus californianus TaxID=6549 RepID=UPI0022482A57|nr:galactoside alpha-(1,2)-fucosyltransferase 2-like isoform X2 [Mytilus californianus]
MSNKRQDQVGTNGFFIWTYGKFYMFCFIAVICFFLLEYADFSGSISIQTLPKMIKHSEMKEIHQDVLLGVTKGLRFPRKTTVSTVAKNTATKPISAKQVTARQSNSSQDLTDFKKTHFMTANGKGRLGNQLFQVACLIGTAYRHNYTPFIPRNHRLNRVLDLKQARDIHMTNTASLGEGKAMAYNSQVEALSHDKNWTLNGYFQSWKYFHHCRHEITSSFKFKQNTKRKVIEILKTVNAKGRPLIGVHIRRGDMSTSFEMKRGYNVATPEFITKAFSYFRNNTNKPLFLVVSDDPRWCKAHVQGPDVIYAGTGSPETDMVLLTFCNHTIITSGSFGWWGAYLSGGKTVYFSDFPRKGSWLASIYNRDDYYLPEWIGMQ